MANSVDLVIGSEAIKQVESLISKLSIADAELLKISQSAMGASKGIAGISTPSGLDKTVSSTTSLNAQLEKQNAIINKLHADLAKKAEQSRLAEIKLQQQREKAFDSFEKNAQKERAIAEKNSSAYNKTQTQINKLTAAYNDLAVRKARYNDLSVNEEMRLNTLAKINGKYNELLKGTDAIIGKNTRSVGNYTGGYNALGNSINQLSREAPAFANSINTGFMALSNNFPALFDAINGIRAQNKLLVAEGKPTTSLFKQLAGSIFSWQTLLSVGVTLLTLYGGKMIEWVIAVSKGADGIKSLKENQSDLNDAIKEGNKDASKEISQLDILYRTATNVALSTEQRLKAVNKLQETYPSYFADISDEIIMNGKATKSYEALREAIFDSARAKAIQSTLEERASERLDKEMKLREDILETETKLAKQRADPKAFLGGEDNAEIFSAEQVTANLENNLNKRKALLRKFREDSLKEDDLLLKAKEKAENKSAVLEADRIKEPKGKKAAQAQAKREDLDHLESYIKPVGTIVDEINKEISRLTTEKIIANEQELPAINEQLRLLLVLKKQLNELPSSSTEIRVAVEQEDIEKLKELSQGVKNYLNSFSAEFMGNSGFSETFAILNDEVEGFGENFAVTFNAIAESAQEVFNFISEASGKRFDSERERLNSQYEFALKGAGDNKAAQEKLAEDLEKKKKEIDNREAKAKQKQAIFNIAIDTIQAVASTFAKLGWPAGILGAAIMTGLGAAQIAMVASQKIPQYFDGTDNHIGGMMLVNDGGGSNFQEKVILPNGKEIMPEGRNVLMNAPKGTKVLTHEQQIMEMLNERGISMSRSYQSNGAMTANEMDAVMAKHFAKIQTNNTTFDRKGFRSWSESNGNRTIQNNNRVSRTGFNV